MITLTYLQICGIVAVVIIAFQSFKVILSLLLHSSMFLKWSIKRKQNAQKLIQKTQREQLKENLKQLANFMDYLDKKLVNSHQRKQFWGDFATSKTSREYWINDLIKRLTPPDVEVKKVEKREGRGEKPTTPKPQCSGDCKTCEHNKK